jgi:outer membrane protein TolC
LATQAEGKRAEAYVRMIRASRLPTVTTSPSYTVQRFSATLGAQNFNQASGSQGLAFAPGRTVRIYTIPLNVNYEADIWLKNRDRQMAEAQRADGAQWDYQATRLSLQTDVASAYFNLIGAEQAIRIQDELIEELQENIHRQELREKAGLVTADAMRVEEQLFLDAKAEREGYVRLKEYALNELAYLTGKAPAQFDAPALRPLDDIPLPDVEALSVPSVLLTRRPDILAEEARLRATKLDVQVARKEYFPKLQLSPQSGLFTTNLGTLFNWQSRLLAFSASLVGSLYAGGLNRANLDLHKAEHESQLHRYFDTIYGAFRETEDALASLKTHKETLVDYENKLTRVTDRLATQQAKLEAGLIVEPDLNPLRIERLQLLQRISQAKTDVLVDALSLYKAVGGTY